MTDNQTTDTVTATPEDKQAQKKRIIIVLVVGVLSLAIFYYLANGVTSILSDSTAVDPAELEQMEQAQ